MFIYDVVLNLHSEHENNVGSTLGKRCINVISTKCAWWVYIYIYIYNSITYLGQGYTLRAFKFILLNEMHVVE